MGSQLAPEESGHWLVLWFAFAGRAFMTSDTAELLWLAAGLHRLETGGTEWPARLAAFEAALANEAAIEKEYIRLFLNPDGAVCPPFQSAYGDEPRLMGPAHRSALAWYRAAGVEPRLTTEPADHIGLLLAFYARLLATENDPDVLDAFAGEHLAWVPGFCDRLARTTRNAFYALLAEVTRKLVEEAR